MTIDSAIPLPIEIDALKALIAAERVTQAGLVVERDRLVTENDTSSPSPACSRAAAGASVETGLRT